MNVLYVRATDTDAVGAVAREIRGSFSGSSVTTSKDLADRVGGWLVVLITHDPSVAATAGRLVRPRDGRVVAPDEVAA